MKTSKSIGAFFAVQWKVICELLSMHKWKTISILLFSIVKLLKTFVELLFLKYATNVVFDYLSEKNGKYQSVIKGCSLFLGSILLLIITENIYKKILVHYQSAITFDAEKRINRKLSTISYEKYENSDFYEQVKLAKQASTEYPQAIYGVIQILNIVVLVVVYAVLLSEINIIYLSILFVSVFVSIFIATNTSKKQMNFWMKHVSPDERRCEYFHDVVKDRVNQQNIQINRSYDFFGNRYSLYNNRMRSNYLKLNLYSFWTELFSSSMFLITFLFAAIIVGKGIAEGRMEIGYFSMTIALLADMFATVKRFTMYILQSNWYVNTMNSYFDILNTPQSTPEHVQSKKYEIEIENLKYKYGQAENYSLNGVSYSFERGQKIALVGENGSGKTTLISIILDLLDHVDGIYRQSDAKKTALLQDFNEYQMTVRENIEIGCGGKSLSEQKIKDILKKVDLYDYIISKPNGINTKLGQLEEGEELSNGQRQRLAIGRLLANEEAKVWILDEPTAYLDPIAEIEMYNLIFSLAGDRLVFFISHRLGFAQKADMVIVLKEGLIVESGTHSELMEKPNGVYQSMFNLQKEWYS